MQLKKIEQSFNTFRGSRVRNGGGGGGLGENKRLITNIMKTIS